MGKEIEIVQKSKLKPREDTHREPEKCHSILETNMWTMTMNYEASNFEDASTFEDARKWQNAMDEELQKTLSSITLSPLQN